MASSRACATHDSATRKTKRPYKEESEGRGDAARAGTVECWPGPSERPGRTGRTAARISAARSSSTRAAATSTSMFARGVAVWGAEKHFFNLRSASRGMLSSGFEDGGRTRGLTQRIHSSLISVFRRSSAFIATLGLGPRRGPRPRISAETSALAFLHY